MRPAEAYRLKYRSTSQNSQEQIETETAVARVVESQDLVPTILDYLGVGDAFAPAVTKTWRMERGAPPPRSLPKKYEAAYVGRHDVHWGS